MLSNRERSPVRRALRRNRSADQHSLLPMVTTSRQGPPRGRVSSGDEGSATSTPRLRRNRSGSGSGDFGNLDMSLPYGSSKYASRRGGVDTNMILKIAIAVLFFIGMAKFILSTDHTASKVRGIYCPMEYPEPFSKCTLPFGTECPFQCINMPVYTREGKCTGEVQCTPEKHCTCDKSRGGEWFCFGGRTHMDDECKQRNYETYEPCVCPRTLAQRTTP
ncbi:unnamed protein product [Cylindrotheca closterium]|uniref:Uncharacterized protein n=1 Tax=Cylindrotheca closterium TaxID=2856 RepID=A0AAD2CR83_9STRA|nr:unnamed protein product [Cylindrotheca closterium]